MTFHNLSLWVDTIILSVYRTYLSKKNDNSEDIAE